MFRLYLSHVPRRNRMDPICAFCPLSGLLSFIRRARGIRLTPCILPLTIWVRLIPQALFTGFLGTDGLMGHPINYPSSDCDICHDLPKHHSRTTWRIHFTYLIGMRHTSIQQNKSLTNVSHQGYIHTANDQIRVNQNLSINSTELKIVKKK